MPRRLFKISRPVQLQVEGLTPSGLKDTSGRLIDGDRDGQPGGNATAILSRRGATIDAIRSGTPSGQNAGIMVIVDARFERDALAGLTTAHRPRRP